MSGVNEVTPELFKEEKAKEGLHSRSFAQPTALVSP